MKRFVFASALLILAGCGGAADTKNNSAQAEIPETETPHAANPPAEDQGVVKPKTAAAKPAAESHTAKPDKTAEDALMDMVIGLPEIREQDEELREKTAGKRRLRSFIKARPSDDSEYYTVGVGEDNGGSMVTIYTFHVYPDNSIMAYDPVKDEELTLKKWRKSL